MTARCDGPRRRRIDIGDHLETHRSHSHADHPQRSRRGVGKVEGSARHERTPIVDAHHRGSPALDARHPNLRSERKRAVRSGHLLHVEDFAAGRGPPVERAAVIGSHVTRGGRHVRLGGRTDAARRDGHERSEQEWETAAGRSDEHAFHRSPGRHHPPFLPWRSLLNGSLSTTFTPEIVCVTALRTVFTALPPTLSAAVRAPLAAALAASSALTPMPFAAWIAPWTSPVATLPSSPPTSALLRITAAEVLPMVSVASTP